MSNFITEITLKVRSLLSSNALSDEQRVVLDLLFHSVKKVTQRDIAQRYDWMGKHPVHDPDQLFKVTETTLRKVRQVIRDLRVIHFAPILSDRSGYWIARTDGEVKEYLTRLEMEAKAQARAWFETYTAMQKSCSITSPFFERQKTLFQ